MFVRGVIMKEGIGFIFKKKYEENYDKRQVKHFAYFRRHSSESQGQLKRILQCFL